MFQIYLTLHKDPKRRSVRSQVTLVAIEIPDSSFTTTNEGFPLFRSYADNTLFSSRNDIPFSCWYTVTTLCFRQNSNCAVDFAAGIVYHSILKKTKKDFDNYNTYINRKISETKWNSYSLLWTGRAHLTVHKVNAPILDPCSYFVRFQISLDFKIWTSMSSYQTMRHRVTHNLIYQERG